MNEVTLARQDAVQRIREIAGDLVHPQSIRIACDARDLNLPRRQLDKEENDEPSQPPFGPHLDSEEIGSHDQLPMPGQELFPSSFMAPLRSRFNPVLL